MSATCNSCGANNNAANVLSFVCEFCGTKNVDEQYLKNIAIQKASVEANSKSYHLGLVSVQGNDISAAEKHFESAVTEDPNNADAWVYLAYCKAAQVKPSNYEKNLGVAQEALQKAKSIDLSSEVVENGSMLVWGKFLTASLSAADYYIDTAQKKFLAYGEDSSARTSATKEASVGFQILKNAILKVEENLEIVATAVVFAYAKVFLTIKSIGSEKTLLDFQSDFGKRIVDINSRRSDLIEIELNKYTEAVVKSIRKLISSNNSNADTENSVDRGPLLKKVAIGFAGVLLVGVLSSIVGGSAGQKSSSDKPVPSAQVSAVPSPEVNQTPQSNNSSEIAQNSSVSIKDVIAPAEGRQALTEMLINATSSFKLAEFKSQLESLPKPPSGDRKIARKLNEQGLALFKAERYVESADIFRQGLELDPSDVEVKNNYVFALLRSGNLNLAENFAGELLTNNPGRSSAWANLAEIYALKGKEEEAARALIIAFQFSSNKDKTLNYLREKSQDSTSEMKNVSARALQYIEKM